MAVVGSAEIVVRAITNKVRGDIQKGFRDARPAIKAEGKAAAEDYAKSFGSGLGSSMGDHVKNVLSGPGITGAAAESGRESGRSFNEAMSGELANADFSDAKKNFENALDGVTDAAHDAGREASDALEREMSSGGRRSGNAFGRGFLNSSFADSATSASKKFTVLIATGNLLGPTIAGLVGVISSAVSGLYAMASAASVAAGALVVLPGAISVAAQAMGALKLAFSGVGSAVSAGFKGATPAVKATGTAARDAQAAVADAAQALGRAQADAARQISAARQSLSRAYRDSAQAAADSSRKVADALDEERDANRDLLDAQRELNFARKEAIEQLQQLAFSAEDAALGEERAGLRLEDAHAKLVAAQSLPVDDRARREAELGFKEAELAFREAKDRNADTAKEAKKAAKAGVDGTDVVVSAREKIRDAEEKVRDAIINTADARRDQQRQAVQSAEAIAAAQSALSQAQLSGARSVADAQEALAEAHQRVADAAAEGTKAADTYGDALDKLSKPARTFVKYLVSLQDEFKKLKSAAGERLFPKLTSALKDIVANVFPLLQTSLRRTGGLLGQMAQDFAHTISSGEGLKNLKKIFKGNNDILAIFTKENKKGKSTIDSLAIVITRLLVAIQPLTERFAKWISSLIRGADAATNTSKKMKGLTDFFEKAGDRAALLGDIIGNIFGILKQLGIAADPAGEGLLKTFEKATGAFEKFLGKDKQQKALGTFFEGVATNMKAIGRLINVVAKEFFSLGDNKGIAGLADGLIPAVKNFGDIGDSLIDAGPALAKFVVSASELVKNLTSGNAIGKFLDNLTWVIDKLNDLTGSGTGKKVLGIAASIAAITRVASLVLMPLKFVFKALIGGPIAVIKQIGKIPGAFGIVKGALGRLKRSFSLFRTGKVTAAFKALKGGSDAAKLALERQMTVDELKVKSLQALEWQADRTALALERVKAGGLPAAGAAGAAGAAPAAGKAVPLATVAASAAPIPPIGKDIPKATGRFSKMGGVLGKLAKGPFKLIGKAFLLMGRGLLAILGPIGLVLVGGFLLFKFFQALYKRSPEFRKFVKGIVDKLKELGEWFKGIVNDYIMPAMDRFFGWVNDNMPTVKRVIGDVFKAIGGFITKHFIPVWNHVLLPAFHKLWDVMQVVFPIVIKIVKIFFKAIKWFITHIFIPYWKLIWKAIQLLWKIAKPILHVLAEIFKALFKAIKWAIVNIFVPYWKMIWKLIKKLWEIAKDVFGKLKSAWEKTLKAIKWVWENVLRPALVAVKTAFESVKTKVINVVRAVKDKWEEMKEKIRTVKDKISDIIEKIKTKFGEIKTAVTNAFSNMGSYAKTGINKFIKFLNNSFIDKINKVTSKFGLKIPHIPELAEGGPIKGRGGPKEDNHLRALSAGEYVVKASSVRAMGEKNMDYLNRYGRPPTGMRMGIGDVVGNVAGAVGDVASGVGGVLKKLPNLNDLDDIFKSGVGKVLQTIVKGAEGLMSAAGFKRGKKGDFSLDGFFFGIMDKLAISAREWGHEKDVVHAREVAAAAAAFNGGSAVGGTGSRGVWLSLRSVGFSAVQAAGIMGNMQTESHFDPHIVQGGGHSMNPAAAGSGGYGLVQWTPGSKLIPYLHGRTPSIGSEIDALKEQLQGKGANGEAAAGAALRAAKTITAATLAFELKYERHAGGPQANRITQAKFWYNKYKDLSISQAGFPGADVGDGGGTGDWRYPLAHRYRITQYPNAGHNPPWSVDIGAPSGTTVLAAASGFIETMRDLGNTSYGRYLRLQHANGVRTLYAHLMKFLVRSGQRVRAGQAIARSNNTGGSTGPHLHFELMPSSNTVSAMRARGVRLATGGIVKATPGGIFANIGEAGRNERVEPLDKQGLSVRDRAMIDLIKASLQQQGGGGGDIHVYPSRGMNEIELANLVSRRVAWKRRAGT